MGKVLQRKFGVKQIIGESRNLTCRECGQRAGLHYGSECPKIEQGKVIFEIFNPDDCPMRSCGERNNCNVTHSSCESYDSSYPYDCPLLNTTIEVKRVGLPKPKKSNNS